MENASTIDFRCARCYQLLQTPEESAGKNARCPECRLLIRIPLPGTLLSRVGLPWEQMSRKRLAAYIATARLVAFKPSVAFRQMKLQGGLRGAMLYSALGYTIGVMGMETWNILIAWLWLTASGKDATEIQTYLLPMLGIAAGYLFIGVPLAATLGNLIGGGILHLCLVLCGGSRHSFETSFRIACYTQSSLMWLTLIPGGALAVSVWNLALSIFAVHYAHEVPMGRAVLTVLLPMIVVLAIALIAVAILIVWLLVLLVP